MPTLSKAVRVDQLPDWELVATVSRCEVDLPEALREELDAALWSLTDAYGEEGYLPPQGWDWSGIRDSSDEAKGRMARYLRQRLAGAGITQFTVTEHLF